MDIGPDNKVKHFREFWHCYRHTEIRPGIDNRGVLNLTKGGGKPMQVYKAQRRKQKSKPSDKKSLTGKEASETSNDEAGPVDLKALETKEVAEAKVSPQKSTPKDPASMSQYSIPAVLPTQSQDIRKQNLDSLNSGTSNTSI